MVTTPNIYIGKAKNINIDKNGNKFCSTCTYISTLNTMTTYQTKIFLWLWYTIYKLAKLRALMLVTMPMNIAVFDSTCNYISTFNTMTTYQTKVCLRLWHPIYTLAKLRTLMLAKCQLMLQLSKVPVLTLVGTMISN